MLDQCPWGHEGETGVFCSDCHEELLHNPILLPNDIERFSKIVEARAIGENAKEESFGKIAERVKLFHEIIEKGLKEIENEVATAATTGVKHGSTAFPVYEQTKGYIKR